MEKPGIAVEAHYVPVQSSRLYEDVAGQIKERILSGALQPGDRLPSHSALAQEFDVSLTVVREAIRHLQTQGLVMVRHGSGIYVCEPSIHSFVEAFSTLLQFAEASTLSLHEVREVLEVEIAGLAAERRTARDLEALRDALERMAAQRGSAAEFMESDLAFHSLLTQATQNEVFRLLLQPLVELLRQSRLGATMGRGRIERSFAGHQQIYERVEAGDRAGSRATMREHLMEVRDRLESGEG